MRFGQVKEVQNDNGAYTDSQLYSEHHPDRASSLQNDEANNAEGKTAICWLHLGRQNNNYCCGSLGLTICYGLRRKPQTIGTS